MPGAGVIKLSGGRPMRAARAKSDARQADGFHRGGRQRGAAEGCFAFPAAGAQNAEEAGEGTACRD